MRAWRVAYTPASASIQFHASEAKIEVPSHSNAREVARVSGVDQTLPIRPSVVRPLQTTPRLLHVPKRQFERTRLEFSPASMPIQSRALGAPVQVQLPSGAQGGARATSASQPAPRQVVPKRPRLESRPVSAPECPIVIKLRTQLQQEHDKRIEAESQLKIAILRIKRLVRRAATERQRRFRAARADRAAIATSTRQLGRHSRVQPVDPILRLPKKLQKIVYDQLRICNLKKPRYDKSTVRLAMAMYCLSPRLLRYFRAHIKMKLPCPRSLQTYMSHWWLPEGFCESIQKGLQRFRATSNSKQPIPVSLTIDDVSLGELIGYNPKRDQLFGVDRDRSSAEEIFATKTALVVMLQGVLQSFCVPIAYYLRHSADLPQNFIEILIQIIRQLRDLGFQVVIIISDMGSNFVKLRRLLIGNSLRCSFFVDGEEIFFLHDAPHMIKCARTHLCSNGFQAVDGRRADWFVVQEVYRIDTEDPTHRQHPKLTSAAMKSGEANAGRLKMRVNHASRILSATTSRLIMLYKDRMENVPEDVAIFTAQVVKAFNDSFDFMNKMATEDHEARKPYQNTPEDLEHIGKLIEFFQLLIPNMSAHSVFLGALVQALRTLPIFFEFLREKFNIEQLQTRLLNQDKEENFFGVIRMGQGSNTNPSEQEFQCQFKKSFFVKGADTCLSSETNCEHVSSDWIVDLTELEHKQTETVLDDWSEEDAKIIFDRCIKMSLKDFLMLDKDTSERYAQFVPEGASKIEEKFFFANLYDVFRQSFVELALQPQLVKKIVQVLALLPNPTEAEFDVKFFVKKWLYRALKEINELLRVKSTKRFRWPELYSSKTFELME